MSNNLNWGVYKEKRLEFFELIVFILENLLDLCEVIFIFIFIVN